MKGSLTESQSHRGPASGGRASVARDSAWKRNGSISPVGARVIVVTGGLAPAAVMENLSAEVIRRSVIRTSGFSGSHSSAVNDDRTAHRS